MQIPKFNEEMLEKEIIEKLQRKGWTFVPANELPRESLQEPLLTTTLANKLHELNNDKYITDDEVYKVLNELKTKPTGINGSKQVLQWLKFGVPIKFEKGREVKYVRLFDYDDIDNNEFIVSRQVVYHGRGNEEVRTDIMLYVNGIPLVNIELKNPVSFSETWWNAFLDIKGYEQTVPELYKYVQIGVAAEQAARYFPIVPWQEEVRIQEWKEMDDEVVGGMRGNGKDEGNDADGGEEERKEDWKETGLLGKGKEREDKERKGKGGKMSDGGEEEKKGMEWKIRPVDAQLEMLSPGRLLDIIKFYLFFRIESGNETKMITRYMQYRAAEKMVKRTLSWKQGEGEKNRGLIWHWQGSGKTLTMIFAAHKLHHLNAMDNPTIFFIVDRLELEDQLYQEFGFLDITKAEYVQTIDDLRKAIKHDQWKGKRGLMITLIHKFRIKELEKLHNELKQFTSVQETIQSRRNVVTFIDEGHRTQYGTMAGLMRDILKEACHYGLTGTPIAKKGRDTYTKFCYLPEEKYLDRYFITDSLKDGFTVKIAYQPRFEKEFHLKKELLEKFLDIQFEELPGNVREPVEERVKFKLNSIKAFLENPERIRVIARDIAEHFNENLNGKYKALVVAGSRKACVLYKRELDKHLPREYSEIVMTFDEKKDKTKKDRKEIGAYLNEFRERHRGKDVETVNKGFKDDFREEENPRLLIVKDMLLTGFDAPILQTMYLDQPLREHRLLQAIARTNRPYRDTKEAGLIIDYVGIIKEFKAALDRYVKDEVSSVLYDMDSMRSEFELTLTDLMDIFGEIPKNEYSEDILIAATEIITENEEEGKNFKENYRKLRKLFEFLSSEPEMIDYFPEFKWLSAIYTYYMRTVMREKKSYTGLVEKYFDKTIRYIHKSTELQSVEKSLPVINFDTEYLENLEKLVANRKTKAANMVFTLNRLILVDKQSDPIYETVAEKVERLMEKWKRKSKDYEELYAYGTQIIKEINTMKERRNKLDLSILEYSLLLRLETEFGKDEALLADVKEISSKFESILFPGWIHQSTVKKAIESHVRRFIRRYVKRYGRSMGQLNSLYKDLLRNVEIYGKTVEAT